MEVAVVINYLRLIGCQHREEGSVLARLNGQGQYTDHQKHFVSVPKYLSQGLWYYDNFFTVQEINCRQLLEAYLRHKMEKTYDLASWIKADNEVMCDANEVHHK